MIDLSVAPAAGLYDIEGNLKIVPFIHDKDGCSYWRIRKPFEAMGLNLAQDNKTLEQHLENCKIVTFNRMPHMQMDAFLRLKLKYGFKVVIDWDDYWILPHDHLIYAGWNRAQMPQIAQEMLRSSHPGGTTIADAVTTTTERLAEKLRTHTDKPVIVLPNAIPLDQGQWVTGEREYGRKNGRALTKTGRIADYSGTRFGYVAGSSHLPDLKYLSPVLNHFPHWNFSLCGYNNPDERLGRKNVWDVMEHIASFRYHNPNYKRVKTMEFDEYAKAYDHIDVSIAPLKPNSFNSFKSSLKAYESGAKKCAFICSDTPPYSDDIPRDIATFCTKNQDWVDAIKKHSDLSFVKDQADALHAWVRENRDINKVSKTRLEFYNSLL